MRYVWGMDIPWSSWHGYASWAAYKAPDGLSTEHVIGLSEMQPKLSKVVTCRVKEILEDTSHACSRVQSSLEANRTLEGPARLQWIRVVD
jgi:hypothetical protein